MRFGRSLGPGYLIHVQPPKFCAFQGRGAVFWGSTDKMGRVAVSGVEKPKAFDW